MRLLLDTHAALWWLHDDERIGADAARQLSAGSNEVLLSAAVVWEVAIKQAIGKLRAPPDWVAVTLKAGARALPISLDHATLAGHLPAHHRDPFDRMLVAQAFSEGAAVVTRDDAIRVYGAPVVW